MSIPSSLKNMELKKKYLKLILLYFIKAVLDACTGSNPRAINKMKWRNYLNVHTMEIRLILSVSKFN